MSDNLTSKQTPDNVVETPSEGLGAPSHIVEGGCYHQSPLPPPDPDPEKVPPASEETWARVLILVLFLGLAAAVVWRYVVR